ncbi:MAG TPA: tyrosine--tRNA ligase [Firmicutes bacterium]|nr:tyrosine--tRNA ligase [Bacillota bacterium]HBM70883.1 tyrosine--tRNA ligase [Bacillota bacterium]
MENIIEDLAYRGLIEQYSDENKIKELLNTKQTVYCGFDPSAVSMHLGNYVMISLLKRFQMHGHKVVAVVGGATGMIGDPSGKSKERNLQTEETLKKNTLAIKNQLEKYIDLTDESKGMIVSNYDWLGKMSMIGFLRDYGKYFSINYMLSKEIVKSRLEAGISFTEFSYQILQSIDFYHLHHEYGVNIQLGGNDQWGNLTSGLELIRKIDGENEECQAMTAHLILRSDGKKFGKSEKGALFLDPNLTSPYALYQYFMNVSDEDAIRFLKIFSFLPKEEIEEVAKLHFASPGARIGQKRVAYEVTKDIHGESAAKEAIAMSEALFSGNVASLNEKEIEEVFGEFKKHIDSSLKAEDLLIALSLASSKREARTFISGNSVSINGNKISDPNELIGKEMALFGKYLIVKRGKKNYALAEF